MASLPQTLPAPTVGLMPSPLSPRSVRRDFEQLFERGARLAPAGSAPADHAQVLALGYVPRVRVDFSGTSFYLTDYFFDDYINFLVAFIAPRRGPRGYVGRVFPRIFYKDSSLVWRVASHYLDSEDEYWIGKGEVRVEQRSDGEYCFSVEETTNLPYELQHALDLASRRKRARRDPLAVPRFLRLGSPGRIEPFADFTAPRRRAEADRALNGGRSIARFRRRHDPGSLTFSKGFEPDFGDGLLEVEHTRSRLFGGAVRKHRVLSTNRLVQYQFVSSPTHVFLNPPQTLDPELTCYGVRALDVQGDEDAFLPGFEYHFLDEDCDPPELYSQIPPGFVGPPSKVDPARSDASAWIEALPVIQEFRRKLLRPDSGSKRRRKA